MENKAQLRSFARKKKGMHSLESRLRERIKELNCLYEISRAAWEAKNDLQIIVSKTLDVLPTAMQHHAQAEASITIYGQTYASRRFPKCRHVITSPLTLERKKIGTIAVGYRPDKKSKGRLGFLQEEKNLLKAVARELSLFIKRASVEADKEKLEVQLQHAKRLAFVGELSAGIAHELNEPLARILGFAQLVRKGGNLSDQQSEDIERIVKASLYTREIIKKLMIFSRQMPQQLTSVNLNSIVTSILYFIDVRFQSRGIEMIRDLDDSLPQIQADEVQMSQVLVNLITNAVHAVPKGGRITIKTARKGNHVRMIVRDTGTGMTKEVRDRIFEPFFTTKPVGHGTGLGLSVVQGIINSHNGKITVSSTPGKGSTFEITLPLQQ